VAIRLAVGVGVAQAPDPVAIEGVDLVVADRDGQWLVQTRGEATPLRGGGPVLQPAHEPDIAVERDDNARPVPQELDVPGSDVAPPGVVGRQRDVVHDVGA
jgi:hypothetical protein